MWIDCRRSRLHLVLGWVDLGVRLGVLEEGYRLVVGEILSRLMAHVGSWPLMLPKARPERWSFQAAHLVA